MNHFELVFESWVLGYVLNSLWQVTLVFAAAWCAAHLVKQLGPRIEHRVWVSALLIQITLPACPLRLSEIWNKLQQFAPWRSGTDAPAGQVHVAIGPATTHENGVLLLPAFLLEIFAAAYIATLLYFIARLAWGLWRTHAVRRHAELLTPTGTAALSWDRYRHLFGINPASVHLAASPKISGPVTLGFRRQMLLVPTGLLQEIDQRDLDAMFAHEFAHMGRHDFAKNLIYELLSLPIAYHPLLWLTRSRLAESREMVCDAMAAEAVAGRESYARSLLRLASMLANQAPARTLHAIGIFDANIFERRVMNLTGKRSEIKGARRFAITAAMTVVALATCATALALRMEVAPRGSAPVTQSDNDQALNVKASVMAGQKISGPNPIYPAQAKADKVQGAVILLLKINKDGEPIDIRVKKGVRADLDESAVTAVQQWRWKPYLLNGDPTEVKTTVTVNYSLEP
jgi:TonB family protein